MKKQLLPFITILQILAGLLSSCKEPEELKEKPTNYPISVSFAEFSLSENSCQWINLPYDETVIIISSSEELEEYISCTEKSYDDIDFSIQSILLISGKTTNVITETTAMELLQSSLTQYKLKVEIATNDISVMDVWSMAFLVEKMSEESVVDLEINVKEEEVIYPRDVPFTDFSFEETSCKRWVKLPEGELIVINSNEEFNNYRYIVCPDNNDPGIDFSKESLLLATGYTTKYVSGILKDLQQFSPTHYKLDIDVQLMNAGHSDEWFIAIVTSKLEKESTIEFNVNFTDEALHWCNCTSEFYYYLANTRIVLDKYFVNNCLLVSFKQNIQDIEIVKYLNGTGFFHPVEADKIFTYRCPQFAEEINRVVFVNTKELKTCLQQKEIIHTLENSPIVSFANLAFTGRFEDIPEAFWRVGAFSSFINVIVKDKNELDDLYTLVQETNTRIIGQIGSQFFISVENSNNNAMYIANYFYESGKIKYASPLPIESDITIKPLR